MSRPDLLAAIAEDLTEVHDRLLWAITDGYHRSNATPRGRRAATDTIADLESDHVKGPRHDLGIGNHRARQAAQAALGRLRKAETHLVVAVFADGHQRQPRPVLPTIEDRHAGVDACTTACRRRLQLLAVDGGHDITAPLRGARRHLDTAVKLLRALDTGDTGGQATAEPLCRICEVRPVAERKAGRCETCAKWIQRNGYERPRSIDQAAVGEAQAAKARRTSRGESWGDESFSAVDVR